jgi:hypothetical protein
MLVVSIARKCLVIASTPLTPGYTTVRVFLWSHLLGDPPGQVVQRLDQAVAAPPAIGLEHASGASVALGQLCRKQQGIGSETGQPITATGYGPESNDSSLCSSLCSS